LFQTSFGLFHVPRWQMQPFFFFFFFLFVAERFVKKNKQKKLNDTFKKHWASSKFSALVLRGEAE
jgi:hypothetical protein